MSPNVLNLGHHRLRLVVSHLNHGGCHCILHEGSWHGSMDKVNFFHTRQNPRVSGVNKGLRTSISVQQAE